MCLAQCGLNMILVGSTRPAGSVVVLWFCIESLVKIAEETLLCAEASRSSSKWTRAFRSLRIKTRYIDLEKGCLVSRMLRRLEKMLLLIKRVMRVSKRRNWGVLGVSCCGAQSLVVGTTGQWGGSARSSQDIFKAEDPAGNDAAIGDNLREILMGAGPPSERHTSVTNNAEDDIAPLNDLGDIIENPGMCNNRRAELCLPSFFEWFARLCSHFVHGLN